MKKYYGCNVCDECEKTLKENIIKTKLKQISEKEFEFCSNDCKKIFQISHKDILTKQINKTIKEYDINVNIQVEILKEKIDTLTDEYTAELEDKYYDGYYNGMKDITNLNCICPHCKEHVIQTVHHILTKERGGYDNELNFIALF